MALRDFAGGAARLNASFWREVAHSVDPKPPRAKLAPDPPSAQAAPATEPDVVAGAGQASGEGMLVPIDTWTRVLEQLGHLHQAGQDLAVARERAAKAETEARFLREQLAEARTQLKSRQRRRPAAPAKARPVPVSAPATEPEISEPPRTRVRMVRGGVIRARSQVSDWLRPAPRPDE